MTLERDTKEIILEIPPPYAEHETRNSVQFNICFESYNRNPVAEVGKKRQN